MPEFTQEEIRFKEAIYYSRIAFVIVYIIWLHIVCKLPLKWSDNNTQLVYLLSPSIILICSADIAFTYLPSIPALHFFLDSVPVITFYISASWYPRYVYGRQLEQTLRGVEKDWKLKLSWMMVVVASPITCATLIVDNFYMKYGSWDVILGRAPWARLDALKLSITGIGITILCLLIVVSYQLYMFYVAFNSHLRLDHQKQRALRLIVSSYMISLTGNSVLGLSMVLNDIPMLAWAGWLNDIGMIVAPLLPLFVKRFSLLERLIMTDINTSSPHTDIDISGISKVSENKLMETTINPKKYPQL